MKPIYRQRLRFESALALLREGGTVRRQDWQSSLTMMVFGVEDVILRSWPSGHLAFYEPIMEDLVAEDWIGAPFPESLPNE